MRKKYNYFIPRGDNDRAQWFNTLGQKGSIIGPNYGLTAAEVTELQDSCTTISDALSRADMKKKEQKEAVSYKDVIQKMLLPKILKLAAKIKLHPDYTENVGNELGIVGSSIITSNTERLMIRPSIKAVATPTHVEITFSKQNQTGVTIYTRLKGQNTWEKLINATQSPYRDERPLTQAGVPEIREYVSMYWDNGVELGQYSDIAFILFGI
ncbi:hypothetical protein HNQ91_001500 [Filimonas zeae]|uniref:Uncharacterized protein n=1 Tax=Filimonas zeae TaxID=1737353 RepID=A0A917IZ74_9BACT|nr:hypothetical protein [Filimonas zeae]MDR6338449.1 hypothetical protein [Filimonas zeae]GGH68210.1 hypothetical protein GCM10011379_24280 [Filimonas zeae]